MWSFEFHKLKGWHKGRQAHWWANYNHDQSRRMAWTERNRITGRDRKINKEELDATLGEEYTVHNELRKRQRELRRQNSKTYQSTPIIMTMPSNVQTLTTQTCTWQSSLHFSRLRLHALHPQTSSPPSNTSRTPSPPSHTAPLTQRAHAVIHPEGHPKNLRRRLGPRIRGLSFVCWTQLNWILVGGRWRRGDTGQNFQVVTCGMCEHQRWKNFLAFSLLGFFFVISGFTFFILEIAVFEYTGVPSKMAKWAFCFRHQSKKALRSSEFNIEFFLPFLVLPPNIKTPAPPGPGLLVLGTEKWNLKAQTTYDEQRKNWNRVNSPSKSEHEHTRIRPQVSQQDRFLGMHNQQSVRVPDKGCEGLFWELLTDSSAFKAMMHASGSSCIYASPHWVAMSCECTDTQKHPGNLTARCCTGLSIRRRSCIAGK